MSIEGGLSSKEYGGTHEKHATGFSVNKGDISDNLVTRTESYHKKNNDDQILSFQDGDIIEKNIDTDTENVQFLSSEDLDSFRTDSQNDSEWLRSRHDSVNFDIPSSSSDEGDFFEASVVDLASGATGISLPLDSDVSGAQIFMSPLNQPVFSTTDTNLVIPPSSIHQNINPVLNADIVTGQISQSIKNNEQTDTCTTENSQTITTIGQNEDFNNTARQSATYNVSKPPGQISEPTVLIAPINANSPQLIQATAIPQTIQVIPPQSSMTPQGNLKFATISISTDKPSNSTHILVNTNQGNQLYKINTADLQQATNAIKPAQEGQQHQTIPQTGYLLLSPDTSNNGLVNIVQMDGVQKVLQIENSPKVFMNSLENKKVFVCPVEGCSKMFRRLSKYKTHQMRHTGERPFKCSKAGCEWAFTTHYKLKRHEESHEGRKSFMCPIPDCGGKFTTVYNLNSHIKLHSRPCTEQCPVEECALKFATKRQLDAHMKSHSGHEKTYKCPHEGCDKVFISALSMGSHPRVHQHNKEDLTCTFEGCGKVFDKTCRLKQHMRSHTGEKPYICGFEGCEWAFTTASKLKRHQAKHTGVRKWVCDLCGKAFMRSEHLKGHKITHSGDKPFACPVEGCGIKFTAKSSLFVHIKKHENGGKKVMYHCPMEGCLKKYSNKPSLRAHIVKHVKQVMSEGNSTQADNLDIMPYLDNDLPDIGLLASIDGPNSTVPEGQTEVTNTDCPQNAPVQETSSGQVMIDPSEFIASSGISETSFITTDSGDVQQISPDVINQILSSMERQDQMATTTSDSIVTPSPSSKTKGTMSNSKSGGSARTDYHGNHLMSERAKKRRNKEASSSVPADTSFQDTAEKNNYMTNSFTSGDGMTSRGITFRDPETGVLYLQTQLLQDDPPNMEMYCEDPEISPDLPVTSCTPLHDNTSIPEFTESTINLQDLE